MSTGTMKYKATERYEFGWTDPRFMDYTTRFEELKTVVIGHFARDMTNDRLRAAWLLMYGDRPISFHSLRKKWEMDETGDDMRVAQETHARGLLLSESDINSYTQIYVLKDKLNASS